MPNFVSGGNGEVGNLYLTDAEFVDQFVGGRLWLWGYNTTGEIGDNTRTNRSSPVQTVSGGTNWELVSAFGTYDARQVFPPPTPPTIIVGAHTASIKTDSSLWLWGSNSVIGGIGRTGQIGDNSTALARSSPVQTVSGGTNWYKVAVGTDHTLAIKTDGTLWAWGQNAGGELGANNTTRRSSPVQTVSGGTNWRDISASFWCSASIKTDGSLWLWGRNDYGQLGDTTRTNRSSPVQTTSGGSNWSKIALGYRFSIGLKTDGTLWSWGDNGLGQLGDNSVTHRSSPVQTVSGGTDWKAIAAGQLSSSAIKTDGTLWSWGYNAVGGLGDNSITHRSSPVQTVSGGTNWKAVAMGREHTVAMKTDSTLWAWGANSVGQLGTGNVTNRSSPVQTVTGGSSWKTISAAMLGTTALTY